MIENLYKMIDYYSISNPMDILSPIYNYELSKWENPEAAMGYIYDIKFFQRFDHDVFCSQIFPKIKLQKYMKDEVIYPTGDHIFIVLIGEVIMKSHKSQVYPSKFMARFREGDIIGSNKDYEETLKIENWWVARWLTLTAVIKSQDFKDIWHILETKENIISIPFLQSSKLLQPLSRISIYKVFYFIQK